MDAFLKGLNHNPNLEYPYLKDGRSFDSSVSRLVEVAEDVRQRETDTDKSEVIVSTIEFRRAEIEYVKLLGRLNEAVQTDEPHDVVKELADNAEVTEEMIRIEKGAAYKAVRIFRGTPTNMTDKYPDIKPITYNKDLSYLNGRVLAMDYIRTLHESNDEAGLRKLFVAKYDPTIPEQAAIVDRYAS